MKTTQKTALAIAAAATLVTAASKETINKAINTYLANEDDKARMDVQSGRMSVGKIASGVFWYAGLVLAAPRTAAKPPSNG